MAANGRVMAGARCHGCGGLGVDSQKLSTDMTPRLADRYIATRVFVAIAAVLV